MSTSTSDPLIASYLRRVQREARGLPHARRDELGQQLEEHLREAVPPDASEADVRNALERLGEPEAIVGEEFERLGIRRATAGKLEWAVIFLLPFGAVVIPFAGWALGIILLWSSRVWSTREKLIGTFVPPGGLSAILYLALVEAGTSTCTSIATPRTTVEHCTDSGTTLPTALGIVLLIAFVIAGIATPIFLGRRAAATRV